MGERPITREDVQGRSRAMELALTDASAAAKAARAISHPWYRCQALAEAAKHSTGRRRNDLLHAAFRAAEEQDEPNRVVTVAAWPLQILALVDLEEAKVRIAKLLEVAEMEPHNLRRAHALQTVAFKLSEQPAALARVIPALASAVLGGGGYRMDRVIRDTFELVAKTNPELLRSLALHHKPNRQQEKLLARSQGLEI